MPRRPRPVAWPGSEFGPFGMSLRPCPLHSMRYPMSLSAKNFCSTCRPSRLALICMALAASPAAFAAAPYAPAGDPLDLIFADGFDGAQPSISTYDDLVEGFLDTTFDYNDVHYPHVN